MDNSFASLLITAICYMAFPLIRLAINNGKFEKKRAKKIALWNSIIVGAFFGIATIATFNGGTTWNASPAVWYYFINRALLTDKYAPESGGPTDKPSTQTSNKATASTSLSNANDKPVAAARNDVYGSEFRVAKSAVPRESNSVPAPSVRPVLFCRKCGNKLAENSVFCNKCGIKVLTDRSDK